MNMQNNVFFSLSMYDNCEILLFSIQQSKETLGYCDTCACDAPFACWKVTVISFARFAKHARTVQLDHVKLLLERKIPGQ